MALEECPHMVARCPHRNDECKEAESIDCFYIKNTTSTAIYTVELLKNASTHVQMLYQPQVKHFSDFLQSTMEKQEQKK